MYGWEIEHGWNLGAEEAFGYLGDILKQWNPTKWRREGNLGGRRGRLRLISGSSQAHLRLISGSAQAHLRPPELISGSSQAPAKLLSGSSQASQAHLSLLSSVRSTSTHHSISLSTMTSFLFVSPLQWHQPAARCTLLLALNRLAD
ncbi:hypothetical protein E2P81_ATG03979 [Venturia nashicola]|nr:hypothetical protein E2P81_ATG03979 [Venturia nashicola]